ncbi:MAG: serine--tRNA ligase [Bacilli bacterium]|nr:serine--tRNA ligase [Bacilli bacterium]
MIDLKLIVEKPDYVQAALKKKAWDFDPQAVIALSQKRKSLILETEANKAEQNKLSAQVPQYKKAGKDPKEIFTQVKALATKNKDKEIELKKIEKEINDIISELPNLPDDDVVSGGKENNKVIKVVNPKPIFNFKVRDHVELAKSLGLVDYERAAKISGEGTWIYTGEGAELEWALINYFISEHLKNGYRFILPPHMLNEASGYGAGQFPKFRNAVFHVEGMGRFLLPTAETALVNFHRNEILKEEDLPKKYFAYTPCYRQEAGSYRTEERGMIRGYQFNKVEIVQYTTDTGSDAAFEEMVNIAAGLVEKLGLHFRLSKLAAADCSHSMARTYDIEVYLPSMNIYKEVSSASNARDYQARRTMARYKAKDGKTHFCHTLNASGLATSRLFPAIIEQFQQPDGSVIIPEVLRPFMGGKTKISPKSK